MTPAHRAVANVHPSPWINVMNHVFLPSADTSQKIRQFQL